MTTSETTSMIGSVRPRPHATVETAFLPPDVVLFDDRHGELHHLNPSASAVWLMLDGELSIDEVAGELSDIFSVPRDEIRPDVEAAVEDFRGRGLLDGSAHPSEASSAAAPADDAAPDDVRDVSPRLEIVGRPPDT